MLFCVSLSAQSSSNKKKEAVPDTIPVYNGIAIGTDLLSAAWFAVGQPYSNFGLQASVSLKEKYHPLIELGYTYATRTMPDELKYRMNQGYYARLGFNYRVIGSPTNYFYVGLRYTHSLFDYTYSNINTPPDYWGNGKPVSADREKGHSGFGSVAAGLYVKIVGQWSMGWNVRYELPIFVSKNSHSAPYIIPGVGIYKGSPVIGIGYSLYYKF